MNILDQTGDLSGQDTYRIMRKFSPPQFVKEASQSDLYGPDEDLPPRAYADPGRKRFPVHTKAATWLSTAFFLKNSEHIDAKVRPWIEGTLDKMSSFYGIKSYVDKLKEEWQKDASFEGMELHDDDFALIVKYPNGTSDRKYPLRNAKEVRAAAEWLKQYKSNIPFEDRAIISRRIIEKAAQFGANTKDLDDFLEKQAGYGGCSTEDVVGLLWNRLNLIGDHNSSPNEMQIELAKMAKVCLEQPEQIRCHESLTKIASIIDQIDRHYNIVHSPVVPPPEDVLFKYTKKQASEFMNQHCKTTTGNVYKVADFKRVKLHDLKDLLGEDFANEVSRDGLMISPEKMEEVASTLPRNDAALLDRLLEDVGILPYSKEASHKSNTRLTKECLREIAKLRK